MNLRVVMIDSSYNARRDIDSKVKWVENDFELVGEASNGEEALALLPHVSPHVIFKWTALPLLKRRKSAGRISSTLSSAIMITLII